MSGTPRRSRHLSPDIEAPKTRLEAGMEIRNEMRLRQIS